MIRAYGRAGVGERPQACHHFRAAAQLDNFCYAKIRTRTVLAENPSDDGKPKRGLIVLDTLLQPKPP